MVNAGWSPRGLRCRGWAAPLRSAGERARISGHAVSTGPLAHVHESVRAISNFVRALARYSHRGAKFVDHR